MYPHCKLSVRVIVFSLYVVLFYAVLFNSTVQFTLYCSKKVYTFFALADMWMSRKTTKKVRIYSPIVIHVFHLSSIPFSYQVNYFASMASELFCQLCYKPVKLDIS